MDDVGVCRYGDGPGPEAMLGDRRSLAEICWSIGGGGGGAGRFGYGPEPP